MIKIIKRIKSLIIGESTTENFPTSVWAVIIALGVIYLWLVGGESLFAIGYSGHDDRLFINLAHNILKGEWLGPYNNLTLAKGPFFPIWIAVMYVLGIPLLLSEHLIYIFACVLFILAIRPILRKNISGILIFAILLFNPMTYTNVTATRVLREGIYPSLTVMVIACSIALLTLQDRSNKNLSYWSVSLGFVLSCFWLTREEGIFIIPTVGMLLTVALFRSYMKEKRFLFRQVYLYLQPFLILLLTIISISTLNLKYYGEFTTTELKQPDFLAAYGALTRVTPKVWLPDVPVQKETRERIYAVSPAFAELKPYLEGSLGNGWSGTSSVLTPQGWKSNKNNEISDEISGGWFVWALRDAVSAAGHYTSSATASDYYRRLANEINGAIAAGKLEAGPPHATMTPVWNNKYLRPLLKDIVHAGIYLVSFRGFSPYSSPSVGTESDFKLFREMTNNNLSILTNHVHLSGWAFDPNSELNLSVLDQNGTVLIPSVRMLQSPDVYEYFLKHGENISNAKMARFTVDIDDINSSTGHNKYFLQVATSMSVIEKIPLDGSIKSLQKPDVSLLLDSVNVNYDQPELESPIDAIKLRMLATVGTLYQAALPVLAVLATLLYLFRTIGLFVRHRRHFVGWAVITSLVISILAQLVIKSLIDITSFPAINTSYLSAAYPILLMYTTLNIGWTIEKIIKE